jgi:putative hydrolase of the HAD superfamily
VINKKNVISEEFGSEKPEMSNFVEVEKFFGNGRFFYFGDNYYKDFIVPNKLRWTTITLLNDGNNIHNANLNNISEIQMPKYEIRNFDDIPISFTE